MITDLNPVMGRLQTEVVVISSLDKTYIKFTYLQ